MQLIVLPKEWFLYGKSDVSYKPNHMGLERWAVGGLNKNRGWKSARV